MMDMISFRFLISLVLFEKLEMRFMDIVTAYLYGSLDSDIYMKIPEGLKMPDACTPRNLFSIKLQRSLYRLKQSDRMWYQRLSAMNGLVAHAGRDGGCVVKPVASHIAPARRCQAPYIVGLPLPSLTSFKPVRHA